MTLNGAWAGVAGGAWGKPRPYVSHQAHETTLRESCRALGITGYAMAKLIGIRNEHYLKWFNGRLRPSQKFLCRVAMLHVFRANGLNLALVDHVDWTRDEVVYKKGVTLGDARGRDSISKFCGTLPEAAGQPGPDRADSDDESSGPPGPRAG